MFSNDDIEIHGRFDWRLVACALQWRMSIALGRLVVSKFFVVIWRSGSRSNRIRRSIGNWYNSRNSGTTKGNKSLGRGFILRHINVYPPLGRSLITLLNGLGQEAVGAFGHTCDAKGPRGGFLQFFSDSQSTRNRVWH